MKKSYITTIDLTSGRKKEDESPEAEHQEPESALPSLTLDTLPEALQAAVKQMGWPSLMPVQEKAIPYLLAKRDLIVQSRTGSGKTGAFLLPLLELLDPRIDGAQALILTPTRELANQIHQAFLDLHEGTPESNRIKTALVYGGVRYKPQLNAFKGGAQLIIGTPGRILDHLDRGTLKLDQLRVLIFDEADEMLSMGFFPAMRDLRRHLHPDRQSYMFSATMPYKVQLLGEEFLHKPGFLRIGSVEVDTMEHQYIVTSPMGKNQVLVQVLELHNPDSAIIFANTKRSVEFLAQFLQNNGFDAAGLTGDLKQSERERIMQRLRDGNLRLLVATDVAARGIDISDLEEILMFDVPQDPEYYVHRAGRTARAGKAGLVVTLATLMDNHILQSIRRKYGIDLDKQPEPVESRVDAHVLERITALLEDEWRHLKPKAKKYIQATFVSVVDYCAGHNEHELMGLLLEEFYRRSLQQTTVRIQIKVQGADEVPDRQTVIDHLNRNLDQKRIAVQKRIQRFLPLVKQCIDEEEPELLAMLAADAYYRETDRQEKPGKRKSKQRQKKPKKENSTD
jgi:ATP-dependent RNA helicase DeaD